MLILFAFTVISLAGRSCQSHYYATLCLSTACAILKKNCQVLLLLGLCLAGLVAKPVWAVTFDEIRQWEDSKEVEPLIKALGDSDYNIRRNAAEALGKVTLGEIGQSKANKEVEPLIKALGDSFWSVRDKAAEALGKIRDPRAVDPLIKALGDLDIYVRWDAAKALGKIGDPRAVEPLIKVLGDSNGNIRSNAAEALGKISDPRAVEPLIKALGDSNVDVRMRAAEALGKIGDPRAVEPLIKAFGDSANNVRSIAVKALSIIHDLSVIELLIKTLGNSDNNMRKGAFENILQNEIVRNKATTILANASIKPFINVLQPWNQNDQEIMLFILHVRDNRNSLPVKALIAAVLLIANVWFIGCSILFGGIGFLIVHKYTYELAIKRLKLEYTLVLWIPVIVLFHLLLCAFWLAFTVNNTQVFVLIIITGFMGAYLLAKKNIFVVPLTLLIGGTIAYFWLYPFIETLVLTFLALVWIMLFPLLLGYSWLLAKRHAHHFICPTCNTRRFYKTQDLPALVRWTNSVFFKEINPKYKDFADYFICDQCHGETKIRGISRIIGLLGGNAPALAPKDEWYVPLWSEAESKARNADIDILIIQADGVSNYEHAVSAIINTLKNDVSRPRNWCRKIPVIIQQVDLSKGTLAMLKDTFKSIQVEEPNHATNH